MRLLTCAEMFYDRGHHFDFISMAQEMAAPGELRHTVSYDFEFKNIEKQYESYWGVNVKLRYHPRDKVVHYPDSKCSGTLFVSRCRGVLRP